MTVEKVGIIEGIVDGPLLGRDVGNEDGILDGWPDGVWALVIANTNTETRAKISCIVCFFSNLNY